MSKSNLVELEKPAQEIVDPLTEVLRQGARKLLTQAVSDEVTAFLATHAGLVDDDGRRR